MQRKPLLHPQREIIGVFHQNHLLCQESSPIFTLIVDRPCVSCWGLGTRWVWDPTFASWTWRRHPPPKWSSWTGASCGRMTSADVTCPLWGARTGGKWKKRCQKIGPWSWCPGMVPTLIPSGYMGRIGVTTRVLLRVSSQPRLNGNMQLVERILKTFHGDEEKIQICWMFVGISRLTWRTRKLHHLYISCLWSPWIWPRANPRLGSVEWRGMCGSGAVIFMILISIPPNWPVAKMLGISRRATSALSGEAVGWDLPPLRAAALEGDAAPRPREDVWAFDAVPRQAISVTRAALEICKDVQSTESLFEGFGYSWSFGLCMQNVLHQMMKTVVNFCARQSIEWNGYDRIQRRSITHMSYTIPLKHMDPQRELNHN